MLTRIQLFEKIRRDRRLEPDVSQRELSRRYNVHRRTVRAALESAIPPPRKKPARGRLSVIGPAAVWIDAMLREDLTAPRKQRHTIQRIHDRLRIERSLDSGDHSAPFPVELPMRCIGAGCKPAGVVLDMFAGTGTTCEAARKLGRKAIGIDLNPASLDLAIRHRLSQGDLFGDAA